MRKLWTILALFAVGTIVAAQAPVPKTLFVFDEPNAQLDPFVNLLRAELAAQGIAFDESAAASVDASRLDGYENIIIYSAVMAFGGKSPVRDWLNRNPKIKDKKVVILVTANRWSLDKLYKQQQALLRKQKANLVDAVSSATKDLTAEAKLRLVRDFIASAKAKMKL